jgi:hypothetical protein
VTNVAMTVRQLIEHLAQFDSDMEVKRADYTWGWSPIEDVRTEVDGDDDEPYVLVE